MRPGLLPGHTEQVELTVTDDMLAAFAEGPVHPVFSTFAMIRWMEWAGRKVILPFLEPHEEAVGYQVDVRHLAPTALGDRVRVSAELTERRGNRIICRVQAYNPREMIGEGTFVQVLLPREALEERIRAAAAAVGHRGAQEADRRPGADPARMDAQPTTEVRAVGDGRPGGGAA